MYNARKYLEAETVEEAVNLLTENPNLTIIAGGTDVLIKIHSGKIEETELLSIRKIKLLETIDILEDKTIVMRTLATFS